MSDLPSVSVESLQEGASQPDLLILAPPRPRTLSAADRARYSWLYTPLGSE